MLVEAMDFLRNLLATGPKPRYMCYLTGQTAGYSRRTLERVVQLLGMVTDFGGQNAVGEATYDLPTAGGAELGGLAGKRRRLHAPLIIREGTWWYSHAKGVEHGGDVDHLLKDGPGHRREITRRRDAHPDQAQHHSAHRAL